MEQEKLPLTWVVSREVSKLWIKRLLLLLLCLSLLPVYCFGSSELEDQIIETLLQDLKVALTELQLLKNQRESYEIKIQEISRTSRESEFSIKTLNKLISDLNVIITLREESLKVSEAEIAKLTEQSSGLKSDLSQAKGISLDFKSLETENEILKWGIGTTIGIAIIEGIIIYVNNR